MSNNNAMTINSTPEAAGGKLFTQEEVNKIVSDRLARERERLADDSEFKAKYESVLAELNDLKAAQVRQAKENAYRAIAKLALDPKKTGYLKENRLNTVIKSALANGIIDGVELDENGTAVGADKLIENIKAEWADFVIFTTSTGAQISRPPTFMVNHDPADRIADAFKPPEI